MNKDHKTMDITGPYAAKEGLQDGLPAAELNGDRDEDGLAVFGKRALLKVRLPRPWLLVLRFHYSEKSASIPWSA